MKKISGGELVVKMLKKEGVECVFTLVGGHIMPIIFACKDYGIEVIDVRHECDAIFAADAYAKTTGRPGVVITTAGPGVTNTLSGMAEAEQISSPIIQIGSAADERRRDTGLLQDVDTLDALKPFCRFCKRVTQGNRIADYVAMAFRHALGNNPGPVYLEIPANLLNDRAGGAYDEETVSIPEKYRTDEVPFGDPETIQAAAQMLADAKKPVLVLGRQARYFAKYGEYVEKLVNHLKMPVLSVPFSNVRGVFGDETKNELFVLGEAAVREADVILELNVTNDTQFIHFSKAPYFNADAKIIQAHPDKTKIGYNAKADIAFVAGAGACAMQLYNAVSEICDARADDSWVDEARELTAAFKHIYIHGSESCDAPINPGRLAKEISNYVETKAPDTHIICDGGETASWMLNIGRASYAGQLISYCNMGTVGSSAGFAMGAWAADKKPVIVCTGDGSFGFYPLEYSIMAKMNIPVVCIICNDRAWGVIKKSQMLQAPEYIKEAGVPDCLNLADVDYEKIAAVWGGLGLKASTYQEIAPAIDAIIASGKPGILNVLVDDQICSQVTYDFSGVTPKYRETF